MHTAMTYPLSSLVAIVLIAPAINVKWTFQNLFYVGIGLCMHQADI